MMVYGMDKTHMATEIETPGCNGWAVIHKSNLKDDGGKNYHIVEVQLVTGQDGKDHIVDYAKKTCCGMALKQPPPDLGNCFSRKEHQDSFRANLSIWQNNGYELCGKCVGHFCKDPSKS